MSLNGTLFEDLHLCLELDVLTLRFFEFQLQVVDSGTHLLQLLGVKAILLLLGQSSEPVDLIGLDLSDIGQSLVFTEQNIDLLFELSIFICCLSTLLLCLKQLLFDLKNGFLVSVAHCSDLCLVLGLQLNLVLLGVFNGLSHDLVQLGDHLLPLLQLAPVLFFLTEEKSLQLTSFISVLITHIV